MAKQTQKGFRTDTLRIILAVILLFSLGYLGQQIFMYYRSLEEIKNINSNATLNNSSAIISSSGAASGKGNINTPQFNSIKASPIKANNNGPLPNLNENAFLSLEKRRPLDFSLHTNGPGGGPTLFVVGGIQGDEPGGFSAASLLVTHYKIKKGLVVVVPNLNFFSIINTNRGPLGDMNRKFAAIDPKDPDFETVTKIKKLLLNPKVDAILNLHDGSGFYRPKWQNPMRNPARWGQSVIIDQTSINSSNYGNLEDIASSVLGQANSVLLAPDHVYHIKNTHTSAGDREMEKTLSYFAIRNGKPAFGVEASKDLPLPVRAWYHTKVIEAFMKSLGIEFERKFTSSPEGVAQALGKNIDFSIANCNIKFSLNNVRSVIRNVPLNPNEELAYSSSSPLVTVINDNKGNSKEYIVYYGNRAVTRIKPEYTTYDKSISSLPIIIDGKNQNATFGETVAVKNAFKIPVLAGYRVNIIGVGGDSLDDSNLEVTKNTVDPNFALDKSGNIYRLEVYKLGEISKNSTKTNDSFTGMVLVKFPQKGASKTANLLLPGGHVPKESSLGY